MEYKIFEEVSKLSIKVEKLAGNQDKVLAALQECAEGRCSCPTNQYEKLDSIDILPGKDSINITLETKAGESIDSAEIDKCLQYTVEKSSEK